MLGESGFNDDQFKQFFPKLINDDGSIPPCYQFLTFGELSKMNLKMNTSSVSKQLSVEERLRLNGVEVTKTKLWEAAEDNLMSVFHPIRFDRAPVASTQSLYVAAAKMWPNKPLIPLKSYDFSAINVTNVITNKGFEEIHNPGSTAISIKMFSKENFKKSAGGAANWSIGHNEAGLPVVNVPECFTEIANMAQFHSAFFALYVLKKRACPWDHSLDVLWEYFINNDWFSGMDIYFSIILLYIFIFYYFII